MTDDTTPSGRAGTPTSGATAGFADPLRLLADNIPALAWAANPDGYIIWYNRRWHEYCGTTPQAMEGWGWQSVHDPKVLPAVLERWTQSIATGMPFEMVFPLRGADATFKPFLTRVEPYRDATGTLTLWFGTNTDISSQVEAERALETARRAADAVSAEKAAILAQLAEGVIVTDLEGNITFVNDAAQRLHGIAPLGVGPDDYSDTYHLFTLDNQPYPPRDLPLARAVGGETINDARWKVRRGDGSEILAIGNARPLTSPEGAQIGAVLTVRDDTARATAEREVIEGNARLQTLTHNLPLGVVYQMRTNEHRPERQFLYVSESVERLTGFSATALLADAELGTEIIEPEDRARFRDAEMIATRDETQLDISVRFRRSDGEVRSCRVISAPRRQEDGSLIWDGIQIDTTDQQRAEQELRELNETLEDRVRERTAERNVLADIFQTADTYLVVIDPAYRILAINRAAVDEWDRKYGVRPAVGESLRDIVARLPDLDRWMALWSRALGGEEFTVIEEFGDPTRGRSFYEIRFNLLRDGDGKMLGAYQFAYDVSERLGSQRRLDDAQEALRQAQKMEAVGQLTGGIAHDFNNLLTVIAGNIDIARRAIAADDLSRAERTMINAQKGAERAATLTQRLLAFSRRQPLQPKRTDIASLLTNMSDLLTHSIGETVQIETVVDAGLWRCEIDPHQLENAILNLCVNGRDAMPRGGKLTIQASNTQFDQAYARKDPEIGAGPYVAILVTDTGQGMPAHVIERAFDPFFTTKEVGQGTGLGLSQVYGFVKQSGGHVRIYSEEGLGTTVKLYLPPLTTDSEDPEVQNVEALVELGTQEETVLVVEDDDDVRAFTVESLRELGYRVLECHDGPSALRLLARQETPISLLLTDVVMPEMSGRELADAARAMQPQLNVLFTTGYARDAIVHGGRLDAGVELLLKPFSIDSLATKVREVLDKVTA